MVQPTIMRDGSTFSELIDDELRSVQVIDRSLGPGTLQYFRFLKRVDARSTQTEETPSSDQARRIKWTFSEEN
jgi:hypothetical protein